ncbi:MAG: hypothetical protein GC136_02110 [Alphaproteobacteria bacterium]|nr:hypothetical protein [Alphaproteobacteria bacterium]
METFLDDEYIKACFKIFEKLATKLESTRPFEVFFKEGKWDQLATAFITPKELKTREGDAYRDITFSAGLIKLGAGNYDYKIEMTLTSTETTDWPFSYKIEAKSPEALFSKLKEFIDWFCLPDVADNDTDLKTAMDYALNCA